MLEDSFRGVYGKFKMEFYRTIFSTVKEREGSLTAMEAFAVDVIHGLGEPTVGEFADFLGISQSNATYKVNNLIKKGYIVRENSDADRREYHLRLSQKYYGYVSEMDRYIKLVVERMEGRFAPRELDTLAHVMDVMSGELMPEAGGREG